MRKSRLQSYEDILEVLVNNPLIIDHIAYEINMNCTILRQHLDFLMKNNLVEERGSDKRTLYAITEKGVSVLRTLNFQKYLGKISNKIRVIDEALEIIRKLEKSEQREEN
ncbi:ArsR family transcriptional regulator [Candidatus Bathyarchaeota archaeon]|nr:ArsR family transcriptional regulator [Candidatus Bathyarchaeota archaeon]